MILRAHVTTTNGITVTLKILRSNADFNLLLKSYVPMPDYTELHLLLKILMPDFTELHLLLKSYILMPDVMT